MLVERQRSINQTKKRYETGLKRIIDTQAAIEACHEKLEQRTPHLHDRQVELVSEATKIEEAFAAIRGVRDSLRLEEFTLSKEVEEATAVRDECEHKLSTVMPALNEAVNSIKPIPRSDITDLKSMKKPPKVIKLMLRALCILL